MKVERARMGFGPRIVSIVLAALVLAHPLAATAITAESRYGVAVIIGNKTYKGQTPAVEFAQNDARAVRRFVIERLGYRPGNIIDLRMTVVIFGSCTRAYPVNAYTHYM